MATLGEVDRVDFIIHPAGVTVAKFRRSKLQDGYVLADAVEVKPSDFSVTLAVQWLEERGFVTRAWPSVYGHPAGVRAWKGMIHPIRTTTQIRRKRREMERAAESWIMAHPDKRAQVCLNGFDFMLDM